MGTRRADTALQAEKKLASMLASGTWKPGEQLREAGVARELGLGRTPVREAFRRLVASGILEQEPNKAPRVRNTDPDELGQLYDLRIELEGFALEAAAKDATPAQRKSLLQAAEGFKNLANSLTDEKHTTPQLFRKLVAVEQKFHETLTQAASNIWLTRMLETTDLLTSVFQRLRRLDPRLTPRQALERSYKRHRELAELVAAGNGEKARDINRQILTETRNREVADLQQEKEI